MTNQDMTFMQLMFYQKKEDQISTIANNAMHDAIFLDNQISCSRCLN